MSRRRSLALALALALAATTFAGCTSARNSLGTRVSSCFRVLPEARAAAGASATFDGVRSLSGAELLTAISEAPHNSPPSAPPVVLTAATRLSTCLVAFEGRFSLSSVSRGWAPQPGPYMNAIVVIRQTSGDVVATVLFRRFPRSIRFFHGSDFVR
jgi:hypothetical protein